MLVGGGEGGGLNRQGIAVRWVHTCLCGKCMTGANEANSGRTQRKTREAAPGHIWMNKEMLRTPRGSLIELNLSAHMNDCAPTTTLFYLPPDCHTATGSALEPPLYSLSSKNWGDAASTDPGRFLLLPHGPGAHNQSQAIARCCRGSPNTNAAY